MGIRIKKVLGYGLTDLKVDADNRIIDPRINPKSRLFSYEKSEVKETEKYLKFLNERKELEPDNFGIVMEIMALEQVISDKKSFYYSPRSCVTHEDEGGLPEVLVITPFGSLSEWTRSDDNLDYYQDFSRRGDNFSEPLVELIDMNLYPYDAYYLNANTGEKVNIDYVNVWRRLKDKHAEDKALRLTDPNIEIKNEVTDEAILALAQKMGFSDPEDLGKNLAQQIPESLTYLNEWGKLFTDPKYLLDLRPMIYTYWN